MEQVTIAAIEGFCIGGGVALAVALDFRIMASNAHIRVPEIGLGMNMSWQSVPRMLHLMGPARTKQAVIMADQRISAEEAYDWGFAQELAEPGKAVDVAMAMAEKVARQPPISVAMTKMTVNRLAYALDDLASHMEVKSRSRCVRPAGAKLDDVRPPFIQAERPARDNARPIELLGRAQEPHVEAGENSELAAPSRVVVLLLPLALERKDLRPITGRQVGDIGLGRDRRAPPDRVIDQGMVLSPQRDLAVMTERRVDGKPGQYLGKFSPIGRVSNLGCCCKELHRRRALPRPVRRVFVILFTVCVAPGGVCRRFRECIDVAVLRMDAFRQFLDNRQGRIVRHVRRESLRLLEQRIDIALIDEGGEVAAPEAGIQSLRLYLQNLGKDLRVVGLEQLGPSFADDLDPGCELLEVLLEEAG